jgi:hypothetical protein
MRTLRSSARAVERVEGGGSFPHEVDVIISRLRLEEIMNKDKDEQAEVEAAMERLKGFIKKPVNYHDPERMRRVRGGRKHEPRGITWRELARYVSCFR